MTPEIASPHTPVSSRGLQPSAVIGFVLVHIAALGVFAIGFSWKGVVLRLVAAAESLRMPRPEPS
jgi:hypothetical protein